MNIRKIAKVLTQPIDLGISTKLIPSHYRELSKKVITFLAVVGTLSVLHFAIQRVLLLIMGLSTRQVLEVAGFKISFTPIFNTGGAFGLFANYSPHDRTLIRTLFDLPDIIILLCLTIAILSFVRMKYLYQFIAISLIFGSRFLYYIEKLAFGYNFVFFDISYGYKKWPVIGISEMAIASAFVFLYIFVFLRFFRLIPLPKQTESRISAGTIRDPLFERRRRLKLILFVIGLNMFVGVLTTTPTQKDIIPTKPVPKEMKLTHSGFFFQKIAENAAMRAREEYKLTIVGVQAIYFVFFSAILLTPVGFLWILVPKRRIGVLYLRSFRGVKRGWAVARRLRRALRPKLRLSGVTDPKESRHPIYLIYWLTMPFIFAIGDNNRVNVLRHNVYLEGNWKRGIRTAFASVHAAVFDCRNLSPNLCWEIMIGMETLSSASVFFIIADNSNLDQLRLDLGKYQLTQSTIETIQEENCFHASDMFHLAEKVKIATT